MTQKKSSNKKYIIKSIAWVVVLLIFVVICINIAPLIAYFLTDKSKPSNDQPTSPKPYLPITYAVNEWQSNKKAKILTTDNLIALVGQNPTTDNTLDFYGNLAELYRFSSLTEPTLSVIDSDGVFELNWYFAHPKDDDDDKALSIAYAQKALNVTSFVYGENGKRLLDTMLHKKSTPRLTGLLLAECKGYTCKLILDKKTLHIAPGKHAKTTTTPAKD